MGTHAPVQLDFKVGFASNDLLLLLLFVIIIIIIIVLIIIIIIIINVINFLIKTFGYA